MNITPAPSRLLRIYNCDWVSQTQSNGKLNLTCSYCGQYDSIQWTGGTLNELMKFYDEFIKEHKDCQMVTAVEKMRNSMGITVGPIDVKDAPDAK